MNDAENENIGKRILIDLDILTNAFWKGVNKGRAQKFLEKIAKDETEIYTPSALIGTIFDWDDRKVAKTILSYYAENSEILSQKIILKEIRRLQINYNEIVQALVNLSVKEEDAFLILVAAVFGLQIMTFNKKHLLGKRGAINNILKKFRLTEVNINEPI